MVMKMDKILVKIYVPKLGEIYDVWIPAHKKIYQIIISLVKVINEINDNCYNLNEMPILYDKLTGEIFDVNLKVNESTIRNGTELILI